jgi:hypothetical protein
MVAMLKTRITEEEEKKAKNIRLERAVVASLLEDTQKEIKTCRSSVNERWIQAERCRYGTNYSTQKTDRKSRWLLGTWKAQSMQQSLIPKEFSSRP